ncbi:hypothetical protein DER45DRAFT_561377 [Fusarium avenaceum]|nr:hypothetical protein DER45DRAFT_561377 [Fusarium avenaceum]
MSPFVYLKLVVAFLFLCSTRASFLLTVQTKTKSSIQTTGLRSQLMWCQRHTSILAVDVPYHSRLHFSSFDVHQLLCCSSVFGM